MPDLDRFLTFAGRAAAVAPVAPASPVGATRPSKITLQLNQTFNPSVAPVAPVAPKSDEGLNDADWQAAFDERAGIMEFDGHLNRGEAERRALVETTAVLGPKPSLH